MSCDTSLPKVAEVCAAAKVSHGLFVTREHTLLLESLTGNRARHPDRAVRPPDKLALPAVRAYGNRRTKAGPHDLHRRQVRNQARVDRPMA